jgi:hypothetical protein
VFAWESPALITFKCVVPLVAEVGQVVLKKKTAARPSLQQVQNNFQTLGLNHGTGSSAS